MPVSSDSSCSDSESSSSDSDSDSDSGDSLESGGTSDDTDFPADGRGAQQAFLSLGTAGFEPVSCSSDDDATLLASKLAANGSCVLRSGLSDASCAAAAAACMDLREAPGRSHLFSSPSSGLGPPCAAESVWLCDAALADAGPQAEPLRLAVSASRAAACAVLGAQGRPAGSLRQLGLPMVAAGRDAAALRERFHDGPDGCPCLAPAGLVSARAGGASSSLLLTAIIYLDAAADEASASLRVAPPPPPPPSRAPKRPRDSPSPTPRLSYHPAAGEVVLIEPGAARSHAGGRISITTWWEAQAEPRSAEDAERSAAGAGPRVFDHVLTPAGHAALSTGPPVRWGLYDRHRRAPCNAHERAIEALLRGVGDTARYVEYWGRAVWQAIPAHADCDEVPLLAARGATPPRPRFPTWGHVLYLEVTPKLAAPTLVYDDEGARRDERRPAARVHVVPAVRCRLLRFPGAWVHAVPRPATEYLGDDDEEEDDEATAAVAPVVRRVLLFNTWEDAPPEGKEEEAAAEADAGQDAGVAPTRDWSAVELAPRPEPAEHETPSPQPSTPSTALVARLMGGPRRRQTAARFRCDNLRAAPETVREALLSLDGASTFQVQ